MESSPTPKQHESELPSAWELWLLNTRLQKSPAVWPKCTVASVGALKWVKLCLSSLSGLILRFRMEIPNMPARWRGRMVVFSLAAILSSGPALSISASQEQPKPEQPSQQSTNRASQEVASKKEKKIERESEAAKPLPAILWRDPGEIASRDLLNGQGGA